ncbi:MAG: glucokinase [Merismopedia sp. SIO2A8]|nr:glucokinase [Merismopedia sp. SIO2A8]
MTQLLAGDIGGTKTILRLVEEEGGDRSGAHNPLRILHEQQYPSTNYPDLVPMVRDFFYESGGVIHREVVPEKACFAIAGPVVNNQSSLTNLSWLLEGDRLQRELNIAQVKLINDFVAIGYGVLGVAETDIHPLQVAPPQPNTPIAVIGAGTGLGQCFLIPQSSPDAPGEVRHHVYASEGGHVDFAPRSELEFQLLKYLLDKYNVTRLSVERVVSGQGIVAIYQFLRDRHIATESPHVGDAIREWEQQAGWAQKTVDPAATIAIAANDKSDYLAERTMQMFVDAYGAEAGNLALKLLPYGGLYIAGGIAAKNLELLKSGSFLQAFAHKGRISDLLKKIPVYVVLNPKVGLVGAAVHAAQL